MEHSLVKDISISDRKQPITRTAFFYGANGGRIFNI